MPSKRDPAKQRRQAQNRAARQARATRREAANRPPERRQESSGGDRETKRSPARGSDRAARPQRVRGGAFTGKPPGYRAAFLALLFSIGAIASVALNYPEVDEAGRAYSFSELAEIEEQREAGEDIPAETRNGLAAAWPFSPLLLLPIAVGALAVRVGQRTPDPTRVWMRCMFAMVIFALLAASIPPGYTILYFPMVIALSVATFQSRKAVAERAAAAATAGSVDDDEVIEATATEEGAVTADAPPADDRDGDRDDDRDGDRDDDRDGDRDDDARR